MDSADRCDAVIIRHDHRLRQKERDFLIDCFLRKQRNLCDDPYACAENPGNTGGEYRISISGGRKWSIPEEPEITVDETGNAQEGQTSTADAVYSVVTGTGAITGQDDATYEMMYQITYPYISLSDEDKERYPALQAALDAKNQAFANSAAESESWYADAAAQSKEIDGEYFTMLYSEEELSVVRADARALSVVGSYSSYGGGAHGMYGYHSYNFDPETGNEIGIRDVVKDIPTLLATIRTRVEAEYPGRTGNYC